MYFLNIIILNYNYSYFLNGITYFFNINIGTEVKIYFQQSRINNKKVSQPTCDASLNTTQPEQYQKEAYHIPGNNFTYNDAKANKAFDGDLATFNQLRDAQKKALVGVVRME